MKTRIYTLLFAATLLLSSCQQKQFYRNESVVFGTIYHITYYASKDLQLEIDATLAKFDSSLSTFNPTSTLSRFNQGGTEPFDLSTDPWMLKVVEKSLEFSKNSNGAFDITVGPLVDLWGFGIKGRSNPTQQEIDSIKAFVGYNMLTLKNKTLSKKDTRTRLDCSAIAKGYACDVVADLLRSKGVNDFLVEIGGEMVLSGHNSTGKNWRIGINKPIDDSTSTNMEWEHKIELTNKSIATSGNYRNFYIKDGKKYAHTIDPHKGKPVLHSLLSTTIIADDCLTADALATACMVLGADSALALINRTPNVECLLICAGPSDKHILQYSTGMKGFITE